MADHLLFIPAAHPLNKVSRDIKIRLRRAQENLPNRAFKNSQALWERALADLRLTISGRLACFDKPVTALADRPLVSLVNEILPLLRKEGVPEPAGQLHAYNLANHIHLLYAFDEPAATIQRIKGKVVEIVSTFPRTAEDIERGRNPGDVLDPYILAATQTLLAAGDFSKAISATVAHKALMIIEGLMGHLHEDILGEMRGNVRAPEPRGEVQEGLDFAYNPFPGADLVQPPWADGSSPRFHQIKSKTGSAKGGDGKRLGDQLKILQNTYAGEIFYDALIGNTLRGHRSKAGVEQAAPGVVVLVDCNVDIRSII